MSTTTQKTITKSELAKLLEVAETEKETIKNDMQAQLEAMQKSEREKELEFKLQLEEMKNMLLSMQGMQQKQEVVDNKYGLEDGITLISNMIGKNSVSIDVSTTVSFPSTGSEESVTPKDVQSMIKFGNNRKLFMNGALEFKDKSDYDAFNIRPRRILSPEYIIGLFALSEKEFLAEVAEATLNKKDTSALHILIYRAGMLYKEGKITQINYEVMEAFKTYFGVGLLDLNIHLLLEQ